MNQKTARLRIGGMTCVSCQNKIAKKLLGTEGVLKADVRYGAGTANVEYDADALSPKAIAEAIEKLGYKVLSGREAGKNGALRIAGLALVIAALYLILDQFGLLNLLSPGQLAEAGMGYGMLFVIGLVTSVHCVAMCGGINLSQCIPQNGKQGDGGRLSALRPSFLYNLGRVISYTVVGFLVGALGSAVTFSIALQGGLKLVAGAFMVIMGLNMLGIFPWLRRLNPRLPKFFAVRIGAEKARSNSPLIVGLLNGLMPCGPLQAMQIFALSTGNPFAGALSMLLFSLGTVPLMFGLGALSTALGGKFTRKVMTVGAVLVVVLGLSMLSQGWSLSGASVPSLSASGAVGAVGAESGAAPGPLTENGVQVVRSTLESGRYPAITVRAGTPVKWIIDAPEGSVNGCNNRMFIGGYGIEHTFKVGENVIEFTPVKPGKVPYSCWMGMIRSAITVVNAGPDADAPAADSSGAAAPKDAATTASAPADGKIPTEDVAIAELATDEFGEPIQAVEIDLTNKGFRPAIVIVQGDRDVALNIRNQTQGADTQLQVASYQTQVPLGAGENPLYFTPDVSFDFSNGDNTFFGYVKVVDDLDDVDIDAIKAEAAAYEPVVYPAEYTLDSDTGADTGASCH